ncbi:MAG: alpha/beta hydrolase [Clostridia bacterium]|nr:alpha/beta hydrolase [Clostridia bacterium]
MEGDSRYITIRGLTIHYHVALPEGPVKHRVFLLSAPGFLTSCWRLILPELTEAGCLCVLCDMPGFGKSQFNDEIPAEQSLRARYLWGVLDTVDLERDGRLQCWHLMAHGSACGTIVEMALQQPDSAASLFMISPILYPPVSRALTPAVRSKAFSGLLRGWMQRNIVGPEHFSKLLTHVYGHEPRKGQAELMRLPLLRLVGHEDVVRRLLLESFSIDTGALSSLFMPAMILWGGEDHILGGAVPRRLREKDYPSAEYHVLASAGHCAMETHSRAVRDFLRGWIREMWN